MRNRTRLKVTPVTDWVLRLGATTVVVVGGLAALTVPASAATQLAAPAPSSFGMLGPVGLVAVGLGIVGMIAGTARRRRDALARGVAARSAAANQTTADRAARVADVQTPVAQTPQSQYIPGPSQPPVVEAVPQREVQSSHAA